MNPKIVFLLNKSLESLSNSNLESAEIYLKQALRLQSDNPHVLRLLGVISAQRKRYSDSLNYLNDSLKASPKNSATLSNLGNVFFELKDYQSALENYDKSIKIDLKNYEAWYNKGNTLHKLKRYAEAVTHYDQALILKPEYEKCWSNKGLSLHELRLYEEAIAHFDKALKVKPDFAEGWSNKGLSLHELKRYEEAIDHFNQALNLKPDYAEGWSNKGVTLNQLKRYDEAIDHFNQALNLKPDYAEGWSNKGLSLNQLKRYDEAIDHFNQALNLKPDYAEAWSNKGLSLHELKCYDEAIAHFNKALSLKDSIDWVLGDLLHTKMKICSWTDLLESLEAISKKVLANEKVVQPFQLMALSDDALLHKKSSEIYIQSGYPFNPVLGTILKRSRSEKIRVGYFSADFQNHATAYLMAELFELHDRSQFELVGFSFGPKINDEMRERLKKSFDQFIEAGEKSDLEVAILSRNLNIDIAVDLKGFTQDARMGIFAHRAAPIQVNYLGYPGTLGTNYIDYIIADKTLIPSEIKPSYSEKVVYLPDSYQVNDRKRSISDKQFTKQELGLPVHGFVFCCFNNNFKILPSTFASWMRILDTIEDSVLWLFQNNSWAAENLKKEAEKAGIATNRLVFAESLPLPDHLARYHQADLFLDTFPCNAHTTASDALWAGLPVLTMMGQSFASRVAASLLNAIRLPELITNSQDEYERLAIELAKNPKRLTEIKVKLAHNRLTTPLFETPRFSRNLEAAYIQMYERYQSDLEPNDITIT